MSITHSIEWAELKRFYIDHLTHSEESARAIGGTTSEMGYSLRNAEPDDQFYGASAEQMRGYLTDGYTVPALAASSTAIADVERPRWRYTDDPEGELDYDAYRNGEPEHYRSRSRRESRAGVSVFIEYGFLAHVKEQTVRDYGAFIIEVLTGIQQIGFDLEVTVQNVAESVYNSQLGTTNIPVSKFGQRIMLSEWSALFAPGGFRHLVFAAKCSAEREGIRVSRGMGSSRFSRWHATFDPARRQLRLGCVSRSSDPFPAEDMRKQARQALSTMG